MTRVALLGVDGLDPAAVDRFSDALPTLAALGERGIDATLEPTHPPHRDSVWPSLYTGTDPSHHGVFGPSPAGEYPDESDPVSRPRVRRPAIWEYLASEGAAVVVDGVPVTHPADPTNGVLVPGPPAPPDEPAYPPGIRDELPDPAEGESDPQDGRLPSLGFGSGDDRVAPIERIDHRGDRFVSLLERESWELAVCRIGSVEAALEAAGSAEHRRRTVYEAVDGVVRSVLDAVDEETTVLVCSTHGVVALETVCYPNALLADRGLLEPATDGSRAGSGSSERTADSRVATRSGGLLGRLRSAGRAVLSGVGLDRIAGGVGAGERTVAWRDSLAFCASGKDVGVRVNLAGREPNGRVPPSQYEDVKEEVLDALCRLETPDGDPAFASVRRREECYDGPFIEHAPDLLCRPTRPEIAVSAALPGRTGAPADGYGRSFEGVLVGAGPAVAADAVERLSVTDVAPLALALLGRPIPSLMTGCVPDGVARDPSIRAAYDGVAVGATSDDPSFDDARVADRFEWLDSSEWWLE